jgi:alpha-glucosidase
MHFHKYPYHANFEFVAQLRPDRKFRTRTGPGRIRVFDDPAGVHHVRVLSSGWMRNDSRTELPKLPRSEGNAPTRVELTPDGTFRWVDADGSVLLSSPGQRFFGRCGEASIFEFVREEGDRFYGLGEKWSGFEHSGRRTKFWNTDVWADFHPQTYIEGKPPPDPVYLSVPYLIVQRRGRYIGLLLDNPYATFVSIDAGVTIGNQMDIAPGGPACFHLGAEEGQPNLYLIVGPSLPELTRKLQQLIGTTPRPPLWALGYHQCRWGYRSESDLRSLDRNFRRHAIPADGLWLDIDYMERFKVFTISRQHFRDPALAFANLARRGRHVVPVLDPGVKREPGDPVYERGKQAGAYCRNSQGGEFVGLVWPGDAVFPDFSHREAFDWWADEVAQFARLGLHGFWIDMNDPSTGPVDNHQMLFDHGRRNHRSYHNQYALGMAAATREGLLRAHPDQRPFVLSRSGFTGSQRHTAIWTGDNSSNYHHLKTCIATTLNLALSGIPFNAPDVGGFGGDATPQLLCDWFKTCFLFPFFRNHTCAGTRAQEPWAFDRKTLEVTRHYIRLRYKLLPYLYQLFIAQEREGEAILRPLFYDFAETRTQPLGLIDDQFLVGANLLQAPIVAEANRSRRVVLPPGTHWWEAATGRWYRGGQKITANGRGLRTPLFIREDSIVPMQVGERTTQSNDLADLELHCFIRSARAGAARLDYTCDDGLTFNYRTGGETRFVATATAQGNSFTLRIESPQIHGRGVKVRLVLYESFKHVIVATVRGSRRLSLQSYRWRFTGDPLQAYISAPIRIV